MEQPFLGRFFPETKKCRFLKNITKNGVKHEITHFSFFSDKYYKTEKYHDKKNISLFRLIRKGGVANLQTKQQKIRTYYIFSRFKPCYRLVFILRIFLITIYMSYNREPTF